MKCGAVERQLGEYLDGQLGGRAAERLEAHLGLCPACRRLRDELKHLTQLTGQLGRAACPVDLRAVILPALAKEETRREASGRPSWAAARGLSLPRLATAAAAAGALTLALGLGVAWQPHESPAPTPDPAMTAVVDLRERHDVNQAQQALGTHDSLILAVPEAATAAGAGSGPGRGEQAGALP